MIQPIKLLDPDTINQIAAGEVIERPASIAKELIENSIDAQATYITVSVTANKDHITSITVTDDGTGIPDTDLELAFAAHATSKISTASDISTCLSLGFRGEALASIASISYVTMITRSASCDIGRRVIVSGGELLESAPFGCAQGTSVCIEQIFFNAPVRRKFLKSRATELAWMYETALAFCLHFPHISFCYQINGHEKISTHGRTTLPEVMQAVGFDDAILPLFATCDHLQVFGYISKWDRTYPTAHKIFLSVNGRRITSLPLVSSIRDGYADLIGKKAFPSAVIHITIAPTEIDPNVHPAKREIRFADEEMVKRTLREAVVQALSDSSLFSEKSSFGSVFSSQAAVVEPSFEKNPVYDIGKTEAASEMGRDTLNTMCEQAAQSHTQNTLYSSPLPPSLAVAEALHSSYAPSWQKKVVQKLRQTNLPSHTETSDAQNLPAHADILELIYVGQIDSAYLVAQVPREDGGLVLVDQHAAHERIRYDQIMAQRKTGLASQEFLEPVIVTLTPVDHAKLPELLPLFHEMGFILEPFGGDSIRITGVPIILGHGEHPSVVQNIISTTLENESYERAVDCIAKKMACHSSIRAGTPLTPERGVDLLRQLAQTREPRTCPHGRPIMIHFSGQKLAHFFERT